MHLDVAALGELLIDFAPAGMNDRSNPLFEANPGGAPCNVLAALTRLGKQTGFLGKVGTDSFGALLRTALQQAGIGADGLCSTSLYHTTLAFVSLTPEGDRSFSFVRNPGADIKLCTEELYKPYLEHCRIFHFGSLSMTDEPVRTATKEAIALAKAAGAVLSFDPNLRPMLWRSEKEAKEAIRYGCSVCNIAKLAENELEFLTGSADIEQGVRQILDTYANIQLLLVTMGPEGSAAYTQDVQVTAPALSGLDVIDTTGAGDTFLGACLSQLLDRDLKLDALTENDLAAILRFANAAAGIVTTRKGSMDCMPSQEEIESFLR